MRQLLLTCKNHPDLRWSCKSIAFTPGYGYNGARHIFYFGSASDPHCHKGPEPLECTCPPTDLILAPGEVYTEEDRKVRGF